MSGDKWVNPKGEVHQMLQLVAESSRLIGDSKYGVLSYANDSPKVEVILTLGDYHLVKGVNDDGVLYYVRELSSRGKKVLSALNKGRRVNIKNLASIDKTSKDCKAPVPSNQYNIAPNSPKAFVIHMLYECSVMSLKSLMVRVIDEFADDNEFKEAIEDLRKLSLVKYDRSNVTYSLTASGEHLHEKLVDCIGDYHSMRKLLKARHHVGGVITCMTLPSKLVIVSDIELALASILEVYDDKRIRPTVARFVDVLQASMDAVLDKAAKIINDHTQQQTEHMKRALSTVNAMDKLLTVCRDVGKPVQREEEIRSFLLMSKLKI